MMVKRKCPDGGTCHHTCYDDGPCWRVGSAAPLTQHGKEWNRRPESRCECGQELEDHVPNLCWVENEDARPWGWAGDGEDHLKSMGEGMRVVITAGQLRALLKGPEGVTAVLEMGGSASDWQEVLGILRTAAWNARMPGGCHTRASHVLTDLTKAVAEALAVEE